jgi:hypothetical protein
VDNQHRKISGYRELSEREISAMNEIKQLERETGALWRQVRDDVLESDPVALALACDRLQEGFMWFVRAVARPADQFRDGHDDRDDDR